MAKKNRKSNNSQSSLDENKAALLSNFDSAECADYDEIMKPNNDIDQEKCNQFLRIASAEEIEEMSTTILIDLIDC